MNTYPNYNPSFLGSNLRLGVDAPTPLTTRIKSIAELKAPRQAPLLPDPLKGIATGQEKRARWADLDLKQDFSDEAFMRGHLQRAGIKVGSNLEPATVRRLKALLRKVGIGAAEVAEAVGLTFKGFLSANPRLPLWAALALILESTGQFDAVAPKVSK